MVLRWFLRSTYCSTEPAPYDAYGPARGKRPCPRGGSLQRPCGTGGRAPVRPRHGRVAPLVGGGGRWLCAHDLVSGSAPPPGAHGRRHRQPEQARKADSAGMGGDRAAHGIHGLELPLDRLGGCAGRCVGRCKPNASLRRRVRDVRSPLLARSRGGPSARALRGGHGRDRRHRARLGGRRGLQRKSACCADRLRERERGALPDGVLAGGGPRRPAGGPLDGKEPAPGGRSAAAPAGSPRPESRLARGRGRRPAGARPREP